MQKQEEKNLLNTSVLFKTSKQVSNPSPSKKSESQSTKTAISPNLALGYQSRLGVALEPCRDGAGLWGRSCCPCTRAGRGWGSLSCCSPALCSGWVQGLSSQLGSELRAPRAAKVQLYLVGQHTSHSVQWEHCRNTAEKKSSSECTELGESVRVNCFSGLANIIFWFG